VDHTAEDNAGRIIQHLAERGFVAA
jgi:hypothetical protein